MKQFIFKLQTSLDVKHKREELQEEALAEATKIFLENTNVLTSLRLRLLDLQETLRGKQSNLINISDLLNYQVYIPVLLERIRQQETVTEESRQAMEKARQKLVQIIQERKILENLRTKHYRAYVQECLWEEQKQIDEMATVNFLRKDSAV
ncbi:MAG: flagellar export protein FliJ [Thermincola sp.]|nr:flagellar export protein FliJ [Thermincola sp.]MDT3701792.1 flagellar export protein FliJ [Thermincola sp.]